MGATKRKGEWVIARRHRRRRERKRSRSQSDDTYSEDEEPPGRPPKRQIIIDSDSEDDIPLGPLRRTKPASSPIPAGLTSGAFSLPIRSSQSPFPPETRLVGSQKLPDSIEHNNPSIIDSLSQLVDEPTIPDTVQPIGEIMVLEAVNDTDIQDLDPIVRTTDTLIQAPVPRARATAIRSSKPKSQHIFNIPKRVNMKKATAPPKADNVALPKQTDFYSNPARLWKQAPRGDDDGRRPDVSNMTLMSISTAAENTRIPTDRRV